MTRTRARRRVRAADRRRHCDEDAARATRRRDANTAPRDATVARDVARHVARARVARARARRRTRDGRDARDERGDATNAGRARATSDDARAWVRILGEHVRDDGDADGDAG